MTEPNIYRRTLIKKTVPSSFLGDSREITVYLPPGYNELLSYPTVYCQDGLDFFQFGRIATLANEQILLHDMEPVIIAGVHVDKNSRTSEYHPEGERFEAYCRFFADELLPFIEGEFPVRPAADQRVVAGDSLGGTVSLHLALQRPDLFTQILSLSGAFLEPTQQALKDTDSCAGMRICQLIGTEETEVNTQWGPLDFLEANRIAKELLVRLGAEVQYKEAPGRHVWGFWQRELSEALRYFFP